MPGLVLAVTGASGALVAKSIVKKSPWPVCLIASKWGRYVYEKECGPIAGLIKLVKESYSNDDLSAAVSSGSVPTVGMIIAPCSSNTLGEIASGISSSLITRAAHCHLKEKRRLILCLRESPLSSIDLENALKVSRAGGIIMPIAPPFYMNLDKQLEKIRLVDLIDSFADRALSLLGHEAKENWETRA